MKMPETVLLLRDLNECQKALAEYKQKIKGEVSKYEELHWEYRQKYQDDYVLPNIQIVNVVVSTNVKEIDVDAVKNDVDTEYYPRQFPGFVHRMTNPKAAVLLFKTGKLICTGVRDISDAYTALDMFTKKFNCVLTGPDGQGDGQEQGQGQAQEDKVKIQNLVISVDFGYYIDLEEAAYSIPRAIYESEQFPGIIYRNVDPRAVFLIFTSGKCICVGTSKLESAFSAAYFIRDILVKGDLLIPRDSAE